MKDDIDSVRGLLDRLKEEKERELLKEVNCSNMFPFVDPRSPGLHCCSVMLQLSNRQK